MKELLFSIKSEDLEWGYLKSSGAGGQKRNKTSSGAFCKHPPSGAEGECSEYREQNKNKRIAFKRMANSLVMRRWIQMRVLEMNSGRTIEKVVDDEMKPENLRIEIMSNGKWVQTSQVYE